MRTLGILAAAALIWTSAPATAITIDGGPAYTPPGGVTFNSISDASCPAGLDCATWTNGITFQFSDLDLGATENLYWGTKIDQFTLGYSADGGGISGSEVFRYDSNTATSISYTGQTTIQTINTPGAVSVDTRMILSFSGVGNVVSDATTLGLSNANGDVGALWLVGDTSFDVNIRIEMAVPVGEPGAGAFQPANVLFNSLDTIGVSQFGSGSSRDTAFYWEAVPEPGTAMLLGAGLMGLGWRRRRS